MSEETTPSPAPAGRLARGEQRKEEEREGSADRESSNSPWRLSCTEGEGGGEEGGEEEGGGGGGGEGVDSNSASSLNITAGGPA